MVQLHIETIPKREYNKNKAYIGDVGKRLFCVVSFLSSSLSTIEKCRLNYQNKLILLPICCQLSFLIFVKDDLFH